MTITTLKTPKATSLAEYLLLPCDGQKTEFANGKIEPMTHGSPLHFAIIKFLQKLLDTHIEAINAELETLASPGLEIPRANDANNVRTPDLVVCGKAQFQAMFHLTKTIFLEGNPPALAIEVASPGNPERDTVEKRLEYAMSKVPEYWIVNPVHGYVLVLVLETDTGVYRELGEYRGDELINSALFSSLKVSAAELLEPV